MILRPEKLRGFYGCLLLALMVFSATSWADVFDNTLTTQDLIIVKPSITTSMSGEALSPWIQTGPDNVGNVGAWGTVQSTIMAPEVGRYSEGGAIYSIYGLQDSSGNTSGVGFVINIRQTSYFTGSVSTGPFAMQGNDTVTLQHDQGTIGRSSFTYQVKFVATGGSINPGSLIIPKQIVGLNRLSGDFGTDPANLFMGSLNLTYTKTGCIASAPSVVNMGVVSALQINADSVDGAPVTINLQCDDNIGVHATMTDMNDLSNTGNTLTLTPGTNAAGGVGVRFIRGDGQTVVYGPASGFVDSSLASQWQVKSNTDSNNYSFVLTPRYVATGGPITAGDANAVASITFAYD